MVDACGSFDCRSRVPWSYVSLLFSNCEKKSSILQTLYSRISDANNVQSSSTSDTAIKLYEETEAAMKFLWVKIEDHIIFCLRHTVSHSENTYLFNCSCNNLVVVHTSGFQPGRYEIEYGTVSLKSISKLNGNHSQSSGGTSTKIAETCYKIQ